MNNYFNTWWKMTLLIFAVLLVVILPGFAFPTWYTIGGEEDEYTFQSVPPAAIPIMAVGSAASGGTPDWGKIGDLFKFIKYEKTITDGVWRDMCHPATYRSETGSIGKNLRIRTYDKRDFNEYDSPDELQTSRHCKDGSLKVGDIVNISFISGNAGKDHETHGPQSSSVATEGHPTDNRDGLYTVLSLHPVGTQAEFTIEVNYPVLAPNAGAEDDSFWCYWYKVDSDQMTCANTSGSRPSGCRHKKLTNATTPFATYQRNGKWGTRGGNIDDLGGSTGSFPYSYEFMRIHFKIVGKDTVLDLGKAEYQPTFANKFGLAVPGEGILSSLPVEREPNKFDRNDENNASETPSGALTSGIVHEGDSIRLYRDNYSVCGRIIIPGEFKAIKTTEKPLLRYRG
tara:strand:- start:8219 stop:9412 length:1194 start_codon:yes stop_codon:yes gene_type:complete